ncbi:NlpC/P60 family protein [Lederbergia graminis]|uniref:C40 family peptidase n=1 Tax=Lederbergia graminis TaxID=735518 RepID=UPI0036D228DC
MKGTLKIALIAIILVIIMLIVYLSVSQKNTEYSLIVKYHHSLQLGTHAKVWNSQQEDLIENKNDRKNNVESEQSNTAFINVSVATLWSEPNKLRSIDRYSATNPVDPWKWTKSMSVDDKLWLVGKTETQALYGQSVTILEEKDDWVKVAVHGQPTPKSDIGYVGWMPKEQIVKDSTFTYDENLLAIVTDPTTWLFHDQGLHSSFLEVSYNTRLPIIAQLDGVTLVSTPRDGYKWISSKSISVTQLEQEIKFPTGEDLVTTAKLFLGMPYVWAGTSGFGFDCSGFTYTIYKAHGITIPRDSSVQAIQGVPVKKEDLQKGDLLLFANNKGKGFVHHVGMYIGNGEMIHAPNSATPVEIIKVFESSYWSSEFAGARRYISIE